MKHQKHQTKNRSITFTMQVHIPKQYFSDDFTDGQGGGGGCQVQDTLCHVQETEHGRKALAVWVFHGRLCLLWERFLSPERLYPWILHVILEGQRRGWRWKSSTVCAAFFLLLLSPQACHSLHAVLISSNRWRIFRLHRSYLETKIKTWSKLIIHAYDLRLKKTDNSCIWLKTTLLLFHQTWMR